MPFQVPKRGIIFDLGDVLLTWSPNTTTPISPRTLQNFLSSQTWFEYECGRINQATCYEKIADEFSVAASQVAEAFSQARESLRPDKSVVSFLKNLKKRPLLKLYAMSNISKEDFAALPNELELSLFDQVFTSGEASMRKPNADFYHHVLREINLNPDQVVFVDDKRENVLAAEGLGIKAFAFDQSTLCNIQKMLDNPIAKGYEYLYSNAKQLDSITDNGIVVKDNFSQLLILEAMQDPSLVNLESNSKGTWNFFAGEAILVPGGYFPDDLDTTSLALTTLSPTKSEYITSVLDRMIEFVNPDGTIQAYFDREKPRTDAVASANVLACFYTFGRGHQLERTLQHLHDVLLHRSYIQGTLYYPSPDCCLGFFTRLLNSSPHDDKLQGTLEPLLKSRVQERVGISGNALDLSMRVLACTSLGIDCSVDRRALLKRQCQDGSWENGWIYRYGSTGVKIGNRGVTTALAVKALASSIMSPSIREGSIA